MSEHANIYAALCAAQSEFPVLTKAAEGQVGTRKYSYLTYDAMIQTLVPILTKHGLVVIHKLDHGSETLHLHTELRFAQDPEQVLFSTWPILADPADPQAVGSALTYGKRYTLGALLAIAAEVDDDGATATKTGGKRVSKKQVNLIGVLFDKASMTETARAEAIKKTTRGRTENAAELHASEASRVIDRLNQIIEDKAKEGTGDPAVAEVDESDEIPGLEKGGAK